MSFLTHPNARELSKSVRATVLVFKDPRSQELLRRIERLAPSDANALIIGETGTGKELVARHIHSLSLRHNQPFVAVNCGAFPESLVESELFGHEKGSFTGATGSKPGWFEAANGGTLFLDEVGDLPLNMQVKLLRVLQEREVVRVGSRTPIPINVRLVAATNVNLVDAVIAGNFREDLFYRLHVATVRLPPLRERQGDILPLAEFFLQEHSQRLNYPPAQLSEEAAEKLLTHSWSGNIRELENAIHHALLVCRNQVIQPADLHLVDMNNTTIRKDSAKQVNSVSIPPEDASLEKVLNSLFEQNIPDLYDYIEEVVFRTAYNYCHGNQLQTGRLLGISRNIVRARLERIGELPPIARKGIVS